MLTQKTRTTSLWSATKRAVCFCIFTGQTARPFYRHKLYRCREGTFSLFIKYRRPLNNKRETDSQRYIEIQWASIWTRIAVRLSVLASIHFLIHSPLCRSDGFSNRFTKNFKREPNFSICKWYPNPEDPDKLVHTFHSKISGECTLMTHARSCSYLVREYRKKCLILLKRTKHKRCCRSIKSLVERKEALPRRDVAKDQHLSIKKYSCKYAMISSLDGNILSKKK